MSDEPWATAGELDAHVFTRRRLAEQGRTFEHEFLVVVEPHGEDPSFEVACLDLDGLQHYIQQVKPVTLRASTAGTAEGENCDALIAFCRRPADAATH